MKRLWQGLLEKRLIDEARDHFARGNHSSEESVSAAVDQIARKKGVSVAKFDGLFAGLAKIKEATAEIQTPHYDIKRSKSAIAQSIDHHQVQKMSRINKILNDYNDVLQLESKEIYHTGRDEKGALAKFKCLKCRKSFASSIDAMKLHADHQ